MVTLDRVKHIDVEADLAIWQRYARAQGVHPAIRAYLNICPDHFYRITDTDRGQFFVTARGWEDLSLMLLAYEEDGIEVSADWFMQYLQYDEIARSFSLFYDLFRSTANGATDAAGLSLAQRLLGEPDALAVRSATECLALASMLLGIISLINCCIPFFQFPLAAAAIVLAIISKKGRPFHGFAIAGLVIGIISVLISIGMTFYWGLVLEMMQDPEFMEMYDEIMRMYMTPTTPAPQ